MAHRHLYRLVYADYCCSLYCGHADVERSPVHDLIALFGQWPRAGRGGDDDDKADDGGGARPPAADSMAASSGGARAELVLAERRVSEPAMAYA